MPESYREKFKYRTIPSVFIGYSLGKKAYKLLNLSTSAIFHFRDVVFHENLFHYSNSSVAHLFPLLISLTAIVIPESHSTSTIPHVPHPSFAPLFSSIIPPSYVSNPPLRRPKRPSKTPVYLNDYVCTSVLVLRIALILMTQAWRNLNFIIKLLHILHGKKL